MAAFTRLLCFVGIAAARSFFDFDDVIRNNAEVSFLQVSKHVTAGNRPVRSEERYDNAKAVDVIQGTDAYTEKDDWWAWGQCEARDALSKSNITSRKPVMWVHVHKAAGTTICCEARRREKVVAPASNCNRLMDDWTKWITWKTGPFTTCKSRSAYMRDKGFTWGAIERWLDTGDLCPDDFMYATLLRDPMIIMESKANTAHRDRAEEEKVAWLNSVVSCIQMGKCKGVKRSMNYKEWYFFDNFMVRTFSGVGPWVPPGGINSSHFDTAVEVLQSFELVLLMEHLNDTRTSQAFKRVIGWPFPATQHANTGYYASMFNDNIRRALKRINSFDLAFYKLAAEKYYP